MRILAVDDDDIILELLKLTLESTGYQDVTLATSGKQALELIAKSDRVFDCLLLDIQMPEMDGVDLCGRVRALAGYRKTPIIMVTAMSDKDYIDQAFVAGASDYVTKPFDVLELSARVRMAEQLSLERQKSEALQLQSLSLAADKRALQQVKAPIETALEIVDVERVISFPAFENYLQQLGRSKYISSSVFAIKIEAVETVYGRASAYEFDTIITDFAEAVSDNLRSAGGLLAYRGNGVYICVCNRRGTEFQEEFQIYLTQSLMEMGLYYGNGQPIDLSFQIGAIYSPGIFATPGSLDILWKALQDVTQAKPKSTKKIFAVNTLLPQKRALKNPRTPEQDDIGIVA